MVNSEKFSTIPIVQANALRKYLIEKPGYAKNAIFTEGLCAEFLKQYSDGERSKLHFG